MSMEILNRDTGPSEKIGTRALLGAALATCLLVASQESSAETTGWQFEVTPYLWAASLSGDVGIGNSPTASVNADFTDIIKNFDFGAMGTFEARRGRWLLLFDGMYTRISGDGAIQTASFNHAEVISTTGILNPVVGYRLWDSERLSFDATVGARIWVVGTKLKLSGTQSVELSDTNAWADPVVGGRLRAKIWQKWFVRAFGDIGGFGVSSHLTWQGFGGLDYEFGQACSLIVGYRALGVDYRPSGFTFDVVEHGPLVGLAIRF
ncbi:MAG: hypothetical protein KF693_02210 [Nitrospira sp.]|nr:hypothetical protein [Nitrospira sp.]